MTYLNIIEKMKVLFDTLLDFKIILIFLGLVAILTILYTIKKLNGKRYVLSIIMSLIIALLISILDNQKALAKTFDNFTTIFFRNIYFPSIYVYISIIVIILISTVVTLLNKKTKKVYKIINSGAFITNSLLFTLILNIIAKNKIDVFSMNSLYTNTPLVVTLEISTSIFLIWVALLFIAYTTNCIIERMTQREEIKVPTINIENNIPQEAAVIPSIESSINVPLVNNEPAPEPINYVHIPQEIITNMTEPVHNNNISFQDLLERISTLETLDENIDDIDIFSLDEKYQKEINISY